MKKEFSNMSIEELEAEYVRNSLRFIEIVCGHEKEEELINLYKDVVRIQFDKGFEFAKSIKAGS